MSSSFCSATYGEKHDYACRYEFVTNTGVHAVMAAAASKGQVFVAGGTAPKASWQTSAPALRKAVQSFKLN